MKFGLLRKIIQRQTWGLSVEIVFFILMFFILNLDNFKS
jgi:hypothetical protein